jgi:hypothetical protein
MPFAHYRCTFCPDNDIHPSGLRFSHRTSKAGHICFLFVLVEKSVCDIPTDVDSREISVKAVLFSIALFSAGHASASCELTTNPCSTDSSGNTYIREQNLGGGYNTYRDGDLYSQTHQQLDGSYKENYSGGGYQIYRNAPDREKPESRDGR